MERSEEERELEQLRKFDKLRKLVQNIWKNHMWMLIGIFVLVLAALLGFAFMRVTYSSTRYIARLTLCFHPKHSGKVGQYDDKYVLLILNRRTTRDAFAAIGGKKDPKRKLIADKIKISSNRKQQHIFSVELFANSEQEAVNYINEFADVCIQEYAGERTRDLQQWKNRLTEEKQGLDNDANKLSAQIADLLVPLQVISPEKDFEHLRKQMGELQSARARLNHQIEGISSRKKQLERDIKEVNPVMLQHLKEIKKFIAELEHLDKEISAATELYTDANPKMIALHSRKRAVEKRRDAFLAEYKIRSIDPQTIRLAETLSTELKSVSDELDTKMSEKRVLDDEIADSEKRLKLFNESQPQIQRLTQQRKVLRESMQRLDDSIAEIDYMQMMVKDDLFINEIARSAVGDQPFSKKNILICTFAALALTSFCAAMLALLEFFFGTVADAKELMLYDEFHYLGVLPTSAKMFSSEDAQKMVFNNLFHKLETLDPKVVFSGALPGARIMSQFFDFLSWNFAMAGKRMLVVDMVQAEQFEPSGDGSGDDTVDTMILTFSGGKCYLPVASRKFLVPSELELLKNDFSLLKDRYDCIFIRHSFALRRSKLFLEQIASICDAALYAVGAGKTPRKHLRDLVAMQIKIKIPIMTILSDHAAAKLEKDLKVETVS